MTIQECKTKKNEHKGMKQLSYDGGGEQPSLIGAECI